MHSNTQFSVQVNGSSSEPFKVMVGVHQGSVLLPLLFIIIRKPYQESLESIVHGTYYMPMILQS